MEKALYDSKWWDYRTMTPQTATLAFAKAYGEAFGLHGDTLLGSRYINCFKGWQSTRPQDWKHYRTMVRLRQFADRWGMKYRDFWDWAFYAWMELGFTAFYPNAFLNARLQNHILGQKEARQDPFLRFAESAFFASAHYCGHWLQDDYNLHLTRAAMKRAGVHLVRDLVSDEHIATGFAQRYLTNYLWPQVTTRPQAEGEHHVGHAFRGKGVGLPVEVPGVPTLGGAPPASDIF